MVAGGWTDRARAPRERCDRSPEQGGRGHLRARVLSWCAPTVSRPAAGDIAARGPAAAGYRRPASRRLAHGGDDRARRADAQRGERVAGPAGPLNR